MSVAGAAVAIAAARRREVTMKRSIGLLRSAYKACGRSLQNDHLVKSSIAVRVEPQEVDAARQPPPGVVDRVPGAFLVPGRQRPEVHPAHRASRDVEDR